MRVGVGTSQSCAKLSLRSALSGPMTGFATVEAEVVSQAVCTLIWGEGSELLVGESGIHLHGCRVGMCRRSRRCRRLSGSGLGARRISGLGTARPFGVMVDLVQTIVESNGRVGQGLRRIGVADVTVNEGALDFGLEAPAELGLKGIVVPLNKASESEELGAVSGYRSRLGQGANGLFRSALEVGIAEVRNQLVGEYLERSKDIGGSTFEVRLDESECLAAEIADGKVNFVIVGLEQHRIQAEVLSEVVQEGSATGPILTVISRRSLDDLSEGRRFSRSRGFGRAGRRQLGGCGLPIEKRCERTGNLVELGLLLLKALSQQKGQVVIRRHG